jgi:parallel beta-helix repeat protein
MEHRIMSIENPTKILVPVFLLLILCTPSPGWAQSCTPTIGATNFATLQSAIDAAAAGATILVSGNCNENIFIGARKENITLDGQGVATINGAATNATVTTVGRGITIQRFIIRGGTNGILVHRGGTATIDGNMIQSTGSNGIQVNRAGFAVIINNFIQNNLGGIGILVQENAAARIGFITGQDVAASPNTIQNNGQRGITVTRASNARIVGNTIRGNGDDGIIVSRNSHANISNNVINGNAGDGIHVASNAGINLGADTGATIFDLPNSTTTNNAGFGVRCANNSYANGRTGALAGNSGQASFGGNCINSLIP